MGEKFIGYIGFNNIVAHRPGFTQRTLAARQLATARKARPLAAAV
jgi:hypothetical protein